LVRKAGFGLYTEQHQKELLECQEALKYDLNSLNVSEIQNYIKDHELYKSVWYM